MRLRIAIVGASPCGQCYAACCKQNGHEFAVLLQGEERRRFAAFARPVTMRHASGAISSELVIPYVDGRCRFLGGDDRCTIYDDRPGACRAFECAAGLDREGIGGHDIFLRRNPRVLRLLESM